MEYKEPKMNLGDYNADFDCLARMYIAGYDNRTEFLTLWIGFRKYDDIELKLLTHLVEDKLNQQLEADAIENHESKTLLTEKIPTKEELINPKSPLPNDLVEHVLSDPLLLKVFNEKRSQWSSEDLSNLSLKSESLIELYEDLLSFQPVLRNPLPDLDEKYLADPSCKTPFQASESWAIHHGYINGDGKWMRHNITLAAFLDILIDEKIIGELVERREIDAYFTKRYGCDMLKDQFKKSKIKVSDKKREFVLLLLAIKDSRNPAN